VKKLILLFTLIFALIGCQNQTKQNLNKFINSEIDGLNEIIHVEDMENGKVAIVLSENSEILNCLMIDTVPQTGEWKIHNKLTLNITSGNNMIYNDGIVSFNNDANTNVVFGAIRDEKIEKVKVRVRNGSFEDGSFQDAKIFNAQGKRIFMKIRKENIRTEVIGLTKDGQIVDKQG
jgi:hypothetical protein